MLRFASLFAPHPDGPTDVSDAVAADLAARARSRARALAWALIGVTLPMFYLDDWLNYVGGPLADDPVVAGATLAWHVVAVVTLGGFLMWERRQPHAPATDTRIAGGLAVWFLLLGGAFGALFWKNAPSGSIYGLALLLVAVLVHAPSRAVLWGYAGALVLALGGALALGTPAPVVAKWTPFFVILTAFPVFVDRALYGQAYRTATAAHRLERVNAELSDTLGALSEAQARLVETEREAERLRISRDLHDSVGAQLSTLLAGVEIARLSGEGTPAIDHVAEDAREAMRQLRETVWALSAVPVTAGALAARLQQYGATRARHAAAAVSVDVAGDPDAELSADAALHVYRIGQEAIGNAVAHSGAAAVRASLTVAAGTLRLVVSDDGTFRPASGDGAAADPLSGYGMRSMRSRATALGGALTLDTGAGTRVELVVPIGT